MKGIRCELRLLEKEMCELELLRKASLTSTGENDARILRLSNDIKKRVDELFRRYNDFHDRISSVTDPFDRSALTLRYLYGMTWQQVAFALGEYDEQYARRRCEKYTARTMIV